MCKIPDAKKLEKKKILIGQLTFNNINSLQYMTHRHLDGGDLKALMSFMFR